MRIVDISEVPEAIEILASWHYREWGHLYPDETVEEFRSDLFRSVSKKFVPSTFIAVEDDIIIGSISILEKDMEINEPWSPWLGNLFVHHQYRNMGTGKQLINHLMARCSENGIYQLYLFTPDSRYYYEKSGWGMIRKMKYHNRTVYVMCRKITHRNILKSYI